MPARRRAEFIRPPATRPRGAEFGRPRATCRLQLKRGFGFDDAARVAPYLAALGISHVYASPFLAARPGSSHGYDIVDYGRLSDELGGAPAFERLVSALRGLDMGLILDFVPNHMGVGGDENPRWADILEWGEASPHASDFDIDWSPLERSLDGKVLLPFLGDHYGSVLERGELVFEFDGERGRFGVRYFGHRFPIAVRDYAPLLEAAANGNDRGLADLASAFAALAGSTTGGTRARAAQLQRELAKCARRPDAGGALAALAAAYAGRPDEPGTFDALHELLERQFYRLAYWRVATQEINYRRFFDINDLAGLRVEDEALFDSVHRLVFRLISEGRLDGLRIDHIDGLYDPAAYCDRLRRETDALTAKRAPLYIVVEKILAPHESLRGWPVDGTTGYEFMNAVHGLFVTAGAERAISGTYRRFTGLTEEFEAVAATAKREALMTNLASELNVLAGMLKRIARRSRRTRDFTLADLRTALMAMIAHLPVYRTYVTAAGVDENDRRYLDWARARARRDHPQLEGSLFRFVDRALRAELLPRASDAYDPAEVLRFAMKSQQLSGAVAAKGVEDTAFYRYHRLVSLNEVGGDPARFGTSPAAFHHMNLQRLATQPLALLTTASHDHKRGEDTRLRIAAISELGNEWRKLVFRWARLNRSKRRDVNDRPAPDRNDEYLLYQTLLGIWSADEAADPASELVERLAAYMQKSVREAKRYSSWIAPNETYEAAVDGFVRSVLDPQRSRAFLSSFAPFAEHIARIAAANGLGQTLLKLTSPGVPDLYQGTDYWDLSLVDPDNRRPVDFTARQTSLSSGCPWPELAARWRSGEIKQRLIAQALALRAQEPALFTSGHYLPLSAAGEHAGHVVAFARCAHDRASTAIVIASRLNADLLALDDSLALAPSRWRDTYLELPAELSGLRYTNVLTGTTIPGAARLAMENLLDYPVALLEGGAVTQPACPKAR
ncbi:MAG TPA: malto-oligosyltrehalose synthase [Gammaproteobacteria bacterium]|nr:malto-oligosyltrehalose synthase [Gammaproteobacteria bacterium]